jgi:type IV pilus assembly protein PilA
MPGWVIALIALGVFGIPGCGIVSAVAIYGVRRYITAAKTAEARSTLRQIANDATSRYTASKALCPSALHPVPATVAHAARYMSAPVDWDPDGTGRTGFACLGFAIDTPQYFSYDYQAHGKNRPGDGFVATAVGDLNGDGVTSKYELKGTIDSDGALRVEPSIAETNPEE